MRGLAASPCQAAPLLEPYDAERRENNVDRRSFYGDCGGEAGQVLNVTQTISIVITADDKHRRSSLKICGFSVAISAFPLL